MDGIAQNAIFCVVSVCPCFTGRGVVGVLVAKLRLVRYNVAEPGIAVVLLNFSPVERNVMIN